MSKIFNIMLTSYKRQLNIKKSQNILGEFQKTYLIEKSLIHQNKILEIEKQCQNVIIDGIVQINPSYIPNNIIQKISQEQMDCINRLANPDTRKALVNRIVCQLILFSIFYLAIIIPDIVFANQESDCLKTIYPQTSFSLQTWLQIDAYSRAAVQFFLIFVSISLCVWIKWGGVMLMCLCCMTMMYSIFTAIWAVIGIYMYWDHLLPQKICSRQIQLYVHFMPLISIIISCIMFWLAKNKSDKVKEATSKDQELKLRYGRGNQSVLPC